MNDAFYLEGGCHYHAIASHRQHGGGFAILYDHADPWSEGDDEDDAVPTVWHVWSVHDTPDGLIARDVTGDVPLGDLSARAAELFPETESKLYFGDAVLDDQCSLPEVQDLAGDDLPLNEICEEDLAEAALLPSVMAVPGTNAAPRPSSGPGAT